VLPINWRNWVSGDVYCEGPIAHKRNWKRLRYRLALAARRRAKKSGVKQKFHVRSGYRSYQEQARLYQLYLDGKGPLAAKPGYSNHNQGKGADVALGEGGPNIGSDARSREALKHFGLCLPVRGENWHTEIGTTWRA